MLHRFHPGIIGAHVTKELHFFDKQPAHTTTASNQRKYFASFPGVDMAVDDPLAGEGHLPHVTQVSQYQPSNVSQGAASSLLSAAQLLQLLTAAYPPVAIQVSMPCYDGFTM